MHICVSGLSSLSTSLPRYMVGGLALRCEFIYESSYVVRVRNSVYTILYLLSVHYGEILLELVYLSSWVEWDKPKTNVNNSPWRNWWTTKMSPVLDMSLVLIQSIHPKPLSFLLHTYTLLSSDSQFLLNLQNSFLSNILQIFIAL